MLRQLSTYINRRYATLAGLLLGALWVWLALGDHFRLPTSIDWNIYSNTPEYHEQGSAKDSSNATDVFDFPAVDSEAIKSICGETQWNSSVIFTCDNSVGGIGNIRNSILNCVRYAISAGGSLVVPQIIVRDAADIARIRTGERTSMDYMFDVPHFMQSLHLSCPGLRLYPKTEDIPNRPDAKNLIALLPESIVDAIPKTGLRNPEQWRGTFYTWLEQFQSSDELKIVELGRSYLQYPIHSDGEAFATTFGSILKFRSDVRVLATTTLRALGDKFNLGFKGNLDEPVLKNSYFGAHLRTEKDAKEGWPGGDWKYSRYDTQSALYLEQASKSNTSVIYVSSGDLNEIHTFSKDAESIRMPVTSKSDLLSGKDKAELEAMAWDQQGLVDFLVMLKSSDFAGVGHSSFAWNIALKRHVYAEKKDHLDGPQMLSDELSQVYGFPRGYPEYAACLWP